MLASQPITPPTISIRMIPITLLHLSPWTNGYITRREEVGSMTDLRAVPV
jgi:hypothetical protein